MLKQTGRRYGPAPKKAPHARMQSPAPMSAERRLELYGPQREITVDEMAKLAGQRGYTFPKGRPTPKRPR